MITKPISKFSIRTNTTAQVRQINSLKQAESDQTARINSDAVGVLTSADPDQRFFLTPPFKNMRNVQHGNGNLVTNSLAFMPPEQNGTLEDRYYLPGTPVVLDKAGSGAGSSQANLIRTGAAPAGYYGADKVLVQKRYKIYTISEDYPTVFVYGPPVTRAEAKGYVLQADERYDGSFYPGSIGGGVARPFGTTFPTDAHGNYLYNDDPFMDIGWSGTTYTVTVNAATCPVIDSISQPSFTLPKVNLMDVLTLTGKHFTGCGFVMVGPYQPAFFSGLGSGGETGRYVLNDTTIQLNIPRDMSPGSYYIYVIGNDGQIGVYPTPFQVLAGP
jgi:hypothetical protein